MKKVNSAFIIDDDDIFIYGTRRVMQELNFCENISVFKNGQEAIDGIKEHIKLGKELPDIILLDINMPIMNGNEATKEIRKFNPTIPIIALTAADIEEVKREYMSIGYNGVITKPFDNYEFFQMINTNIQQSKLEKVS